MYRVCANRNCSIWLQAKIRLYTENQAQGMLSLQPLSAYLQQTSTVWHLSRLLSVPACDGHGVWIERGGVDAGHPLDHGSGQFHHCHHLQVCRHLLLQQLVHRLPLLTGLLSQHYHDVVGGLCMNANPMYSHCFLPLLGFPVCLFRHAPIGVVQCLCHVYCSVFMGTFSVVQCHVFWCVGVDMATIVLSCTRCTGVSACRWPLFVLSCSGVLVCLSQIWALLCCPFSGIEVYSGRCDYYL